MDFDWYMFSLDAEVDAYGTSRIAGAHNRLREGGVMTHGSFDRDTGELWCGEYGSDGTWDVDEVECVGCLRAEIHRMRKLHGALLNTLAPSKSSWVQRVVRNARAALTAAKGE